ncbi:hypothetical protein [Domibacillus sp.]|uniref:hypothetical protein n=1 Tax=Domibacillus sp. TaxID=1969783 RepID=UPI002810BD04|nr:hypothetical protein [Domibacillus sp.]
MFFVLPRKINVEGEKLAEELARSHHTCKMYEIDKFEVKLRELFWKIKERNNVKTLDRAANADHQRWALSTT